MIKIYMVRHGETQYNLEHRIQGWCDSPLTQKGIDQAQALAKQLEGISFQGAYASPLKRAMDTANILLGERELSVKTIEDLKEFHFGSIEGEEDYKYIAKDGSSHREGFVKYGGENIAMLKERLLRGMNNIVSQHQEGNILVVSHGAAIRYLLQEILHTDKDYYIENCEVTYIDYENNVFCTKENKQIKGF